MMKLKNTPIKIYNEIAVKREDLCVSKPGPSFSKMRGLLERMINLKNLGYKNIGYTETSISMAGWGIAQIAKEIGLNAIIYDPQYIAYKKMPPHLKKLNYHRKMWTKFSPTIIPYPAGMASVNININRIDLLKKYSDAIMLPLGLPFQETITETAKQAQPLQGKYKSIVICVGSGTICAGILRSLSNVNIYGVMTRSGNIKIKKNKIIKKSKQTLNGLVGKPINLNIIDPGWEYTERSIIEAPFPCHPFYDLKAWEWLQENKNKLEEPILFWNIGA